MEYKKYVNKISNILADHKKSVDNMISWYNSEISEKDKYIKKLRDSGNFTEKYINEEISNFKLKFDYSGQLLTLSKKNEAKANIYLDLIEHQINDYINQPSNSDFLNKITAFKTMGVQPTNAEFKALKKGANSYTEIRLLNELAKARTEEKEEIKLDKKVLNDSNSNLDEALNKEKVKVSNPYLMDIIDADSLINSFEAFKSDITTALKFYTGENLELVSLLPGYYQEGEQPDGKKITSDTGLYNYIPKASASVNLMTNQTNENTDHFVENMEEANSILSKAKILLASQQTEEEKQIIDTLISGTSDFYKQTQAEKLAKESSEYANLLIKDSRYKATVQKALGIEE